MIVHFESPLLNSFSLKQFLSLSFLTFLTENALLFYWKINTSISFFWQTTFKQQGALTNCVIGRLTMTSALITQQTILYSDIIFTLETEYQKSCYISQLSMTKMLKLKYIFPDIPERFFPCQIQFSPVFPDAMNPRTLILSYIYYQRGQENVNLYRCN